MHSCWSIFNSVLLAFWFECIWFKFTCENALENKIKKIKKENPANPLGLIPFPRPASLSPHRTAAAQTAQAGALPLLSHRQPGPARQSPLSHLPSSSQPCREQGKLPSRAKTVIPRSLAFFEESNLYKVPKHPEGPLSHPRSSIRALAVAFFGVWISPWTPTAAARNCSFPGRADLRGELAISFSSLQCLRCCFWWTAASLWWTPARSLTPAMEIRRGRSCSGEEAGQPRPDRIPAVRLRIDDRD
jgi:hypothetical protein